MNVKEEGEGGEEEKKKQELLLLKVRVHRRTKKLREIAFGGSSDQAEDASAAEDTDQETPPTPGPRHSAPDEKWL